MRLAFVVADVRTQQPSYATAYLALTAARRGHDVLHVGVDDLTLTPAGEVHARVTRPAHACATTAELCAALAADDARVSEESLMDCDVVFLRYHPHREAHGAGNPAIEFGWRLRLGGVRVVNDPEGTQRAGARMYLSGLAPAYRPRTLISREPAKLKEFLRALDAPAILKPLSEDGDDDLYFSVARGQVKNLNQIITVVRKTGYVVAQEYLPQVKVGEKRLLLLAGEPIRVGKRVAIYKRIWDEARTTSTRKRTDFGPVEQQLVDALRPKLLADGLYFVGVDIVGDKVLELHVYTPGGIHTNQELYGIDIAGVLIKDLEQRA